LKKVDYKKKIKMMVRLFALKDILNA